MSESNPIRVFVTHMFSEHPDYHRVFEYLESASNFFYVNCSSPDAIPTSGGQEAIRETLARQIRDAEIMIVISTMHSENRNVIAYEMSVAEEAGIPMIALEPFGGTGKVPVEVEARCAEVIAWNERTIVDVIRREARHEETHRWDVVEFDLS
jgi:Thoeris protein ThsB, TIR-like domain